MPTISVIVPVYKVEKYIHRCVDSILGQTYADFELILVDDGSPDNCSAICGYAQTEGAEPEISPGTLKPVLWNTEDFYVKHNVNATIACGKLYRKECFREIRYPVGKIHEDEFTTYKILFAFDSVAVIAAPLYAYYTNPCGIVGSRASIFREDKYLAIEEQIHFLCENNFPSACRSQIRTYMCMVCDKLERFSTKSEINPDFQKIIKGKKRKSIPHYAKCLLPDDPVDAWVLTKVYPRRMWFYWHWQALLRRLRETK